MDINILSYFWLELRSFSCIEFVILTFFGRKIQITRYLKKRLHHKLLFSILNLPLINQEIDSAGIELERFIKLFHGLVICKYLSV